MPAASYSSGRGNVSLAVSLEAQQQLDNYVVFARLAQA